MDPSDAAPFDPFAYVFQNPETLASASDSPTRSQPQCRTQSHTSSSLRHSPTRSETSRKRKRDDGSVFSSATTDFATSTRDKTKALLCGQCFHCEMKPGAYSPMDVCHVIPKKSAHYARHSAEGLLDFSLDDIANSILLCKSCHTVFDDPEPGFTFLPSNLEYFIQFEEVDFKRRQAIVGEFEKEHLHNISSLAFPHPPRRSPTAEEYLNAWIVMEPRWPLSALGGAYTRFTMPDYAQRPQEMRLQAWHGAPLAAILHAFRAILGNLSPPEFVTPNVKRQLRKLQDLYERRLESQRDHHSINFGKLPSPNTHATASPHTPSPELGPTTPLLAPPQSSFPARDSSESQPGRQSHDAQPPMNSAAGIFPSISDQTHRSTEASLEHSSKKRPRTSSSTAPPRQHRRRRRSSPQSLTPALTHEVSTISQQGSIGPQLCAPLTYSEGGEDRKQTREDPFSHVFRYHWKWGPENSTQETVKRFLSLSHDEGTRMAGSTTSIGP